MFPMDYSGSTENTAGWTCAICGQWVAPSVAHWCSGQSPTWTCAICGQWVAPVVKDVELHAKLDEIIELLKKIVKE